jgi:hypothetical protein
MKGIPVKTDIALSCHPLPRGGADLKLKTPGADMSIPMDRPGVLGMVASLLKVAGIERAIFDDGRLAVLAER